MVDPEHSQTSSGGLSTGRVRDEPARQVGEHVRADTHGRRAHRRRVGRQNLHGRGARFLLQSFGNSEWPRRRLAALRVGDREAGRKRPGVHLAEPGHGGRAATRGATRWSGVPRSPAATAAESSQSLTGKPLRRGRCTECSPARVTTSTCRSSPTPPGGINFDLVNIVNRAPTSISGFPRYTGGRAAAEQFLARSRDPLIMGVCAPDAPTCDPRKAYYENYFGSGTSWDTILTALGQRAKDACTAEAAKPGAPFSDAECQEVRRQVRDGCPPPHPRSAAHPRAGRLQRPSRAEREHSPIVTLLRSPRRSRATSSRRSGTRWPSPRS